MSTIAAAQRCEGILMHESKSCRNVKRKKCSKQFRSKIPADVETNAESCQLQVAAKSSAFFTANATSRSLQAQTPLPVPDVPISAWEHLLRTTDALKPLHPERVCKNTSGLQILLGVDFDKPELCFNPSVSTAYKELKNRSGTSLSKQSAPTCHKKKPRTKRSATKPGSKEKVTCGICFEVLSSRKSMLKHQRTHANWKEARFQCGFCHAPFNDVDDLLRHREQHMTLEKPYLCLKCERPFPTRKSLMNHKRTHAPTHAPVSMTT